MKAADVQSDDVLTNNGIWMVREVIRADDRVSLRLSASRTDPGWWYGYCPTSELNIWRP